MKLIKIDNGIKLIVAKGIKGDGLIWRGEWMSGREYFELDVVSRGGASWISLRDHNAGYDPLTDTGMWWQCMVADSLAEAARDKAEQWAENPIDEQVEPGRYSALHHAAKAAEYSTAAFGAAAPAWSATGIYSYPDVVTFTNGHTYRCIGTNVSGASSAPSIGGVDNVTYWTRITMDVTGFFELDLYGDLMPMIYPVASLVFELDENGDITYQ